MLQKKITELWKKTKTKHNTSGCHRRSGEARGVRRSIPQKTRKKFVTQRTQSRHTHIHSPKVSLESAIPPSHKYMPLDCEGKLKELKNPPRQRTCKPRTFLLWGDSDHGTTVPSCDGTNMGKTSCFVMTLNISKDPCSLNPKTIPVASL